jgi:hypothetical protein
MAAALRAEGLLLPEEPQALADTAATTKHVPGKTKKGKKQAAAADDNDAAGLGVVDSTPALTPAQQQQRAEEEALSKWLQLHCG